MPADFEGDQDLRSRLVREKFFCVRPRPLERWLWSKRITASAERVFWLHWQEGMQRGDWCSEIPLSRVARECHLDLSTVTRAYQLLAKLGCVRRTDQGRDPANPFQQATALTEVRIPHELLMELNRHPNRRPNSNPSHPRKQSRAVADPLTKPPTAAQTATPEKEAALNTQSSSKVEPSRAAPDRDERAASEDPFPGLTGRARTQAISELIDSLSATERHAYQEALRMHQPSMIFDTDSKASASTQISIRQILTLMSRPCATSEYSSGSRGIPSPPRQAPQRRKLTTFELGRLSRDLQLATSTSEAPELMRQVVWSIETGALTRFDTRHALHIALKKIREGHWTRPHRMPPNWARVLSNAPALEPCGHA